MPSQPWAYIYPFPVDFSTRSLRYSFFSGVRPNISESLRVVVGMRHVIGSFCALGIAAIAFGCGAGLPPAVPDPSTAVQDGTSQGCALTGTNLDFNVTTQGSTLFWATDPQIQLPQDQAKAKLLFDVPDDQLPSGVTFAQIRIAPQPDSTLPIGGHVDTAFQISAIIPADLTGFTGAGPTPPTLTIRYDPVACGITAATEATLVLGRLNASGSWTEVCGDAADVSAHEVSCNVSDLSFGYFAVIPKGGVLNDTTPPFFPAKGTASLSGTPCYTCVPPYIALTWGAATDGSGSGIKGYRIYVDNNRDTFAANLTGNPLQFIFTPTGTVDITQSHLYQITAVDNADNESTLYGALRLP